MQWAVNFRVRNFSFKKSSHLESSVTDRNRDLSVKAVFRLQIRSETLTTCTVQLIWLHKFYCDSVLKSYPITKKAKSKNVSRWQELISQYDHRVNIMLKHSGVYQRNAKYYRGCLRTNPLWRSRSWWDENIFSDEAKPIIWTGEKRKFPRENNNGWNSKLVK